MSIAYNEAPAPARRPLHRLIGAVTWFLAIFARGIEAANAFESLNRLSDAQLARRGLTRNDIAKVAMKVLLDNR